MRRAVLLYNPNAGRPRHRQAIISRIAEALREAGLEVHAVSTECPATAGRQAAELADTADILFACGGDGTIHEVLQGMAHHPTCSLGIIPLGSANALARHLKLSLNPVEAAIQQLNRIPQTVPIGLVTYTTPQGERSRYFLVMAGAGPDGLLVYNMLSDSKHALGRLAYYLRAARLFASTHLSAFYITVNGRNFAVVSALAVRGSDLGGLFSPLVRGAAVDHSHLTLAIAKTPAALSLPAWFALSWARLHDLNRYATTLTTPTFSCGPGLSASIHVQADGEHLGTTPMTAILIPNAIRLLVPDLLTRESGGHLTSR